jgi:hypothetical protein
MSKALSTSEPADASFLDAERRGLPQDQTTRKDKNKNALLRAGVRGWHGFVQPVF